MLGYRRLLRLSQGFLGGHGQGGGDCYGGAFGGCGGSTFGASLGCLCVVLGVIGDRVAIGIAQALTAVAAATLTTRATTRTIAAFTAFLVVFDLLAVQQHFFFADCFGLFGARLTLFTRRARLALFTWLALGALLLLCLLLFAAGRYCVQRLAQFTATLFARLTGFTRLTLTAIFLAFATRLARLARLTGFARLTFFTGFARLTLFTRFAGFARLAFFTRFALFALATLIALVAFTTLAAVAVATAVATVLLATVAALVATRLAFGGLGFDDRLLLFFLAGEQAHQRLDQALEQARLRRRCGRCQRGCRSRCGRARRSGFQRGFLAHQGAGGADRLGVFDFGRGHFVAGLAAQHFRAVVAQALDFEVRGFQVVVRQDHDARTGAQLDLGDAVALLVEQEGGNRDRHLGANLGGAVLQGFFLDQAQDGQRQRFDVADDALAVAARADDAAGLAEGRTQALTGHFQQAEARDATDLNAGAVGFQGFADFLFHGALVLGRGHVDEVDHDQAADVAQAQLASDLFGRFQVGLQGSFFDVAAFGGARRVDVDGHQGFGRVDDDGAAGWQFHFTLEGGFDLAFDLEAVEQRHAVFIQLDLAGVLRHDLLDEGQGFFLGFDAVDQHFADVLAQVVADGADDDVGFLIDQERRGAALRGFLDRGPQLDQVVQVEL